jgi:hypothetical protein
LPVGGMPLNALLLARLMAHRGNPFMTGSIRSLLCFSQ